MPIDAIAAAASEWEIALPEVPGVEPTPGVDAPAATDGQGFGGLLADQIGNLSELQTEAAAQSQALATGTAEDASEVVMAVERAQLSMQLAAQLRDKGLEAFQEIFRTQV